MRPKPSYPKKHKTYCPPKIISVSGVKKPYSSVTRYELPEGKQRVFFSRTGVDPEKLAIQWGLVKAGLLVEEPFEREPKGEKRLMGYFSAGNTVQDILPMLNPREKRNVAKQIIDLITKLHNMETSHKHPHLKNMAIRSGKLRLIDFKLVKRVSPDWAEARSIFNCFRTEYAVLRNDLGILELPYKERKALLRRLISGYKKMPKAEREKLCQIVLESIMAQIVKF